MERYTQDNEEYDELQLRFDSTVKKLLVPGEYVMMSCLVYKFNKRQKRQERSLLVTSKSIYNINKQDFLVNLISIFNGNYAIRRVIDITKLAGITVSELSSEFVVHIKNEYDYRFASQDRRDRIITMICKSYWMNTKNKLIPFFFKNDINLIDFTTTEDDIKKPIIRMPKDNATLMDEHSLQVESRKIEETVKKIEKMKETTEMVFNKNTTAGPKVTLDDFEIIKVLGRGAFGKVMLVEKKDNKQLYALKSMHKEDIIGKEQIEHTKTERYVLEKSKCPFLVSLEYAFQTPEKIFFVMKYMKGGELFQHLKAARRFDEERFEALSNLFNIDRAKLYVAEIVLALEYLHNLDVIYRDLKPENILMDEDGHICLADFGMSKHLKDGELTFSFVGTPEYLAPEIIKGEGHSRPADWWALGILTYEMMVGLPPFYNRDQNTQKMFNCIKDKEVGFTTKVTLSPEAKDLVLQLLKKRPEDRLGYRGASDIKAHKWFSNIDWKLLTQKKIEPTFKPKITSEYDVNNFDSEFTKEEPCNSVIANANMRLVNKYQKEFKDFTYMPNSSLLNNG